MTEESSEKYHKSSYQLQLDLLLKLLSISKLKSFTICINVDIKPINQFIARNDPKNGITIRTIILAGERSYVNLTALNNKNPIQSHTANPNKIPNTFIGTIPILNSSTGPIKAQGASEKPDNTRNSLPFLTV